MPWLVPVCAVTSPTIARGALVACLLIALAPIPTTAEDNAPAVARTGPTTHVPNVAQRGSLGLPLVFEPQKTSSGSRTFVVRHGRGPIVIGSTEIAIGRDSDIAPSWDPSGQIVASSKTSRDAVRVRLLGANPESVPNGEARLEGHSNYFIGSDPAGWRMGVPHYGRVRSQDVYPGIDALFHATSGELELDFVIAPGADPSVIALEYEGAGALHLTDSGDLAFESGSARFTQRRPVAYQLVRGARRLIDAGFVLEGGVIRFRLGAYDRGRPLAIDPVLTYATYIGGAQENTINAIALGPDGTEYLTGTTTLAPGENPQGFVAHLNAAGNAFVYTTYFGGGLGAEYANDIVVGANGEAWVTGATTSSDFPVISPLYAVSAGGQCVYWWVLTYPCADAFVVRLDSAGAVVWSTPLGGTSDDTGRGIAWDGAAGIFVGGTNGPENLSSERSFVLRIDAPTQAITYRTTLSGPATITAIAADSAGATYATGYVHRDDAYLPGSSTFQPTPGAVQPVFGGDQCESFKGLISEACGDAFVAKLAPGNGSLVFATFLGGTADDAATDILLDPDGSIVVGGWTRSVDFPTRLASQPVNRSRTEERASSGYRGRLAPDGFVTRLNATATAIEFSTYLGGMRDDAVLGLSRAPDGSLVVVGSTWSNDLAADVHAGTPSLDLVLASDDDGAHWAGSADDLPARGVQSVVPHPVHSGTLYVVTVDGRLFETEDGGHSWRDVSPQPVPVNLSGPLVQSVFLDAADPSIVYAAEGGRVYRSTNGAATWEATSQPTDSPSVTLTVVGSTLYAVSPLCPNGECVYRSTDRGTTWTQLGLSAEMRGSGTRVAGSVADANTVYITNYEGLFRSTDGGVTFDVLDSEPLHGVDIVHPADARTVYSAGYGEVTRSTDGGATWAPFGVGLPPATSATPVAIDQAPRFTLYSSTYDTAPTRTRFFATASNEAQWIEIPMPYPSSSWWSIAHTTSSPPSGSVPPTGGPGRLYLWNSGFANVAALFVTRMTGWDATPPVVATVAPLTGLAKPAAGAAVDGAGTVHVAGQTNVPTLPTTATAVQRAFGGNADGFVLRLQDASSTLDADNDGLPDVWAAQTGLLTDHSGPDEDPDGDGLTNAQEAAIGSHPRGFVRRYLAEGATGALFSTSIVVANASPANDAHVLLRFERADGVPVSWPLDVPKVSRRSVAVEDLPGLAQAEFATLVESDVEVLVDRRMTWDASAYGSHAERAVDSPATTWYLAEGATHSGFNLFYLLQNLNDVAAQVTVMYLRPTPLRPVPRTYTVGAHRRFTIWVNAEAPELASTDVSATISATHPIIVERAMYLDAGGRQFGAGHESAGVTAPATRWFLAEGATGAFFDLFVLVANPDTRAADITATFLLPTGESIQKQYVVEPQSRFNIWVNATDARLVDTAVSTIVESTNGVPVVVERAMWWPGPTAASWYEAHGAVGAAAASSRWAFADGEVGGRDATETYILIANTSADDALVLVTLLFEEGATAAQWFTVAASSRFNVAVAAEFPQARGRRFAAVVEAFATGPASGGISLPADLVVERAVYSNANGMFWAAGAAAPATPLAAPQQRVSDPR